MRYALALSLALHIGAALVIIIASSYSTAGKSPASFIFQEISLTPQISAPAQPMIAPPPVQRPASTLPSPTPTLETEKPAQEPLPEQPAIPSGNAGEEGGLMSTPLGLGMTHGYFSGLADGKTLRNDIRGYYFEMVEKINREWWDKAGHLKEPLRRDGIFELLIQRDGTVVTTRVLQSTGSVEADRLVTEIIRNTSPLQSLPASYEMNFFRAPLRIKAPSFLFRMGSAKE